MRHGTISSMELVALRKMFPAGTGVSLVKMNDDQAPPIGTKGKVMCVDDIGTIHVAWENGSTLGVLYGIDTVEKGEQNGF